MRNRFKVGLASAAAILLACGSAAAEQGAGAGAATGSGAPGQAGSAAMRQQQEQQQGSGAGQMGSGATGGMAGASAQQPAVRTTLAEIGSSPSQYFGKRVTLTSEVDRTINPHFFVVSGAGQPGSTLPGTQPKSARDTIADAGRDAAAAGRDALDKAGRDVLGASGSGAQAGKQLSVLVPSPVKAATENDTVTITGTVRPFVIAEVERDYEWFENGWVREAEIDVDTTTVPVIVADSITTRDGTQLVQTGTQRDLQAGDAPKPGTDPGPHGGGMGAPGTGSGAHGSGTGGAGSMGGSGGAGSTGEMQNR
jgi:hypothetical protein